MKQTRKEVKILESSKRKKNFKQKEIIRNRFKIDQKEGSDMGNESRGEQQAERAGETEKERVR